MRFIRGFFRKVIRLMVVTATLTAVVVVLDAILSPDGDPRRQ